MVSVENCALRGELVSAYDIVKDVGILWYIWLQITMFVLLLFATSL